MFKLGFYVGYVSDSILDLDENSTAKNINYHFGKLFSIFTDYLVILKSDEEISKEKIFWLTHPKNHTIIYEHAQQEKLEQIEEIGDEILEDLESLEDSLEESLESIESLESSEELLDHIEGFFYDSSESIEYIEEIENITIESIPKFTIMKEDCGPDGCNFLFAGSNMSDQAIGKPQL